MLITVSAIFLASHQASAQTSGCKLFSKSVKPHVTDAPALLGYLRANSGHTEGCDLEALTRLKLLFQQDVSGKTAWIEVFAQYMEFAVACRACGHSLAPAFDALMWIGEPVVPAMLKIVVDPSSNERRREHALFLVMGNWRGAKGVQALADAARDSSNADVIKAVRGAVRSCAPEEKPPARLRSQTSVNDPTCQFVSRRRHTYGESDQRANFKLQDSYPGRRPGARESAGSSFYQNTVACSSHTNKMGGPPVEIPAAWATTSCPSGDSRHLVMSSSEPKCNSAIR